MGLAPSGMHAARLRACRQCGSYMMICPGCDATADLNLVNLEARLVLITRAWTQIIMKLL